MRLRILFPETLEMAEILTIAMRDLHISRLIRLDRTRYCLIFLRARLADTHEALLLIDTAASSTVLMPSAAARLSLTASAAQFGGRSIDDAKSFAYRKAQLGSLTAAGQTVDHFPVLISQRTLHYAESHYAAYGINEVDGLLGADFLRRFRVFIDVGNKELCLSDPDEAGAMPAGSRVPFQQARFAIIIEVEVAPGITGNFLFDTGAAWTVFSPSLIERLGVPPADREVIPLQNARGLGGPIRQFVSIRHPAVQLGGIEVPTEFVMMQELNFGPAFGGLRIDGILGGHLLYNFRVTIDYRTRYLWLDQSH